MSLRLFKTSSPKDSKHSVKFQSLVLAVDEESAKVLTRVKYNLNPEHEIDLDEISVGEGKLIYESVDYPSGEFHYGTTV